MPDGGIRVLFRETAGRGILRSVKLTEELFWESTLILHRPDPSSREFRCWRLRDAISGSVWGESIAVSSVNVKRMVEGCVGTSKVDSVYEVDNRR